jgi:hypothetical protein
LEKPDFGAGMFGQCPDPEVRIISQHPLLRTSETKGH